MGEPAGKLEAPPFEIELDQKAREWLTEHPRQGSLVIAYSNKRCCGGAQICDVQLRFEQPVRGMGPLKGLSLDLTGDDWARVLYS